MGQRGSTAKINRKKAKNKLRWKTAWTGYTNDYKLDEEVESLDKRLEIRTERIISVLKSGDPPIDLFKEVITFVDELNEKTVKEILECREDINKLKGSRKKKAKKEDLFKLVVDEYLENSLKMLEFCSELVRFLASAITSHFCIDEEIQKFEKAKMDHCNNVSNMNKILDNLKRLSDSAVLDSHSTSTAPSLLKQIEDLFVQQNKMLRSLILKQNEVNKKIDGAFLWKRATNTILISATVAFLVCTVVTAALVPAVAVALTAITPLIAEGAHWIVAFWEKLESALQAERDVIDSMQKGTLFAKKELGDIKVHINDLQTWIESIMEMANIAISDDEKVDGVVKSIKDKLKTFLEKINELEGEALGCKTRITEGRKRILESLSRN